MLLDRFGPRRVEALLLLFAAAGAALFALGRDIADLALARALIGLGVSACLMAAFKAFSQWFPLDRQASLTGWIMSAGGLGALVATAPLEFALQETGWRTIFLGLAGLTLLVALVLFVSVPEKRDGPAPDALSAQWRGVCRVFASPHFWRFAPLGMFVTGGFMAIQSLWSVSWLMQVNSYSRSEAAEHMAAMSVAMLLSYVLIGLLVGKLARRGIKTVTLLAGALFLSLATLGLIVFEISEYTMILWVVYGTCSSFGTLAYSQTAAGFPVALSGRANTAFNLLVFAGAFSTQWGLGLLLDWLQGRGHGLGEAYRLTFASLLCLQVMAYLWFLFAGRSAALTPPAGRLPDASANGKKLSGHAESNSTR